jgi:hypothetical protein
MPEHLGAQPTLDDPIDVWREWWTARDEWRKAAGAPNVLGDWLTDVSQLMRLHNRRWASNGRALSQAVRNAGTDGDRTSR